MLACGAEAVVARQQRLLAETAETTLGPAHEREDEGASPSGSSTPRAGPWERHRDLGRHEAAIPGEVTYPDLSGEAIHDDGIISSGITTAIQAVTMPTTRR